MIRYPLAVALVLWYARPEWLQRARARGKIRAVIKLAAVPQAGFWGALRLRWRKLRQREPRPESYAPRHARCDPPRVLRIRPAEIGMAWTLIPRDRVSGTPHEETLPGFAVPWLTARSA